MFDFKTIYVMYIFQLLKKITEYWTLQIFRNLVQIWTVSCHIKAMLLVISRHFDICPLLLVFHLTFGFPCTLGLLHNFFFCRLVSIPDGLETTSLQKALISWSSFETTLSPAFFFFNYNENLNLREKNMFLFCLCFVYLKCFRIECFSASVWMNECIWRNEWMNIYVK